MPPLAASTATMAMPQKPVHGPALPSTAHVGGVAFKMQSKSAVALVNERRIEFIRARNSRALATIDEATGKIMSTKSKLVKKDKDVLVPKEDVERLLAWKHSKKIGPGLANLGNTCYLNSVLQCLSYTPSFVQYLLQKEILAKFGAGGAAMGQQQQQQQQQQHGNKFHKHMSQNQQQQQSISSGGFCAARVMARLFQSVHGGAARVLQPKEIVMNIRHVSKMFRIGRQEDSHEFFRLLLDAIQRSCLRKAHIKPDSNHPAENTTLVHRTFGGKLKNSLLCAKCGFESTRLDDFLDLSLEINNGISSLKGALKHFTATETLDDSNAWKCSNCHKLSRAQKGMTIETCPNVLVVQLKRFDGIYGGKIKKHIEFGTTLDLAIGMQKSSEERKRGRTKYELHAVLVHAGFSTNCGHYYAFVKGSSGQWYEMNDETVRWVSLETVLQQKAYMLFYSRVLPASEQPAPKEKPVKKEKEVVEKKDAESLGVPVKPSELAVEKKETKPTSELSMNGFLSSLRTDLLPSDEKMEDTTVEDKADTLLKVPVAIKRTTVVTYKVSVPVKNRATLKRRLVPVFAGPVGRFVRFQPTAWKASVPLRMMTEETLTIVNDQPAKTTTVVVAEPSNGHANEPSATTAAVVAPKVVKVAFNPREMRGFGEKNVALYGKAVDQWGAADEENGPTRLESVVVEKHEQVLQRMKAEDWQHRRAQRKSSWDEELDQGKVKKLKKRKEFVANEGKANAFQVALLHKKQKN